MILTDEFRDLIYARASAIGIGIGLMLDPECGSVVVRSQRFCIATKLRLTADHNFSYRQLLQAVEPAVIVEAGLIKIKNWLCEQDGSNPGPVFEVESRTRKPYVMPDFKCLKVDRR